jgi:hypothetical protein
MVWLAQSEEGRRKRLTPDGLVVLIDLDGEVIRDGAVQPLLGIDGSQDAAGLRGASQVRSASTRAATGRRTGRRAGRRARRQAEPVQARPRVQGTRTSKSEWDQAEQ